MNRIPRHIQLGGQRRLYCLLFILHFLLLTFYFLLLPASLHAQEPSPDLPDEADPAAGLVIYQNRCASCHGLEGLGDGELAAQAVNPPTAIGSPAYLATVDPDLMFNVIQNGRLTSGMPGFGVGNNSDPLSTAEIWSVIAALYELPALNEPLETAVVRGQIVNATTNGHVSGGTALLQAFDPAFHEVLSLEEPVTETGQFSFDLERVPKQWLYRVIYTYEGLEFSSEFGQLSVQNSLLELPVSVYEQTTDPAVLRISQVDTIIEFVADKVRLNQLYLVDNVAPAVFVGTEGDFQQGTFTVSVPEQATNITFLRGIGGGAADFAPATERMTQLNATQWALQLPVASGNGAVRLLVRYELPYEREVTVSHPVLYPTSLATLVWQDEAIMVEEEIWRTPLNAASEMFMRVQRPPLAQGERLQFTLTGSPTIVLDEQGNTVLYRDEPRELVVGVVALVVVLAAAVFTAYRWRTRPPAEDERDTLLRTLAALDEAYAAGKLRKTSYEQRRRHIKARLVSLWENE